MRVLRVLFLVIVTRLCYQYEVALPRDASIARHGVNFHIYDREVDLSHYECESPTMFMLSPFTSLAKRAATASGINVFMIELRGRLFSMFGWNDSNSFPVLEDDDFGMRMPRTLLITMRVNDNFFRNHENTNSSNSNTLSTSLALIIFAVGILASTLVARLYSCIKNLYASEVEKAITFYESRYYDLSSSGRYLEAFDHLHSAIRFVQSSKGDAHVDVATFKHLLAKACNNLQLYTSAEVLLYEVRDTYDLFGSHDEHSLDLLQDLLTSFHCQGLVERASAVSEEIAELKEFMGLFESYKRRRGHRSTGEAASEEPLEETTCCAAAVASSRRSSSTTGDDLLSDDESKGSDADMTVKETPMFYRGSASLLSKKDTHTISPSSIADMW